MVSPPLGVTWTSPALIMTLFAVPLCHSLCKEISLYLPLNWAALRSVFVATMAMLLDEPRCRLSGGISRICMATLGLLSLMATIQRRMPSITWAGSTLLLRSLVPTSKVHVLTPSKGMLRIFCESLRDPTPGTIWVLPGKGILCVFESPMRM